MSQATNILVSHVGLLLSVACTCVSCCSVILQLVVMYYDYFEIIEYSHSRIICLPAYNLICSRYFFLYREVSEAVCNVLRFFFK